MKSWIVIGLVVVTFTVAVLEAARSDDVHWRLYKSKYNKVYADPAEESMRKAIFLENKQKIERHNAQLAAKLGYQMGFNHLTDRSEQELASPKISKEDADRIKAKQAMFSVEEKPEFLKKILEVEVKDLPKEVDWRKVPGRVGPIKDNGYCLGSWAFAATGVLEGQQYRLAKNFSQVIPLSEENLLDCSKSNNGCQGGFVDDALKDIVAAGGIESEHDYPYVLINKRRDFHKCTFNASRSVMTVKGSQVLDNTEETLMKVVAQFGPVATAMDRTSNLIFYDNGVFFDPYCSSDPAEMTQAVLVVGYGRDRMQGDYWIVKNNWGDWFGYKGYFKMARNHENNCGIANYATIPVF